MDWTWYLFRFDGRINRAKLWLGGLVLLALMMAVGTAIVAIHSLFGSGTALHFGASDLFKLVDPEAYRSLTWADLPRLVVKLFVTSLLMWICFAISIKRLHDRDKSGWWLLVFYLLPSVLSWFSDVSFIFAVASFAFSIWGLVELGFLRGTIGANKYGPDPLPV